MFFPEKTSVFQAPWGLSQPNKKKRKNWDNFLPKGRPRGGKLSTGWSKPSPNLSEVNV
jgi:hypothetical protein